MIEYRSGNNELFPVGKLYEVDYEMDKEIKKNANTGGYFFMAFSRVYCVNAHCIYVGIIL